MPHTVIKFAYIQFDESWQRDAPDVTYVATQPEARLAVVRESPVVGEETYYFVMRERGDRVLVSYEHNLVFVPADCQKRNQSNTTECGKPPMP